MARDENGSGVERTVIVKLGEADYQRLLRISERENIKPSVFVENATLNEINNTKERESGNGTIQD